MAPSQSFGLAPRHWFGRGVAAGVILVAAANAVSYFFRSDGWSDLIGATTNQTEAVGFPFEIWRENTFYNGWIVNYPVAMLNIAIGLSLGSLLGIAAVWARGKLNSWAKEFQSSSEFSELRQPFKLQFSVKGLMIATAAVSVIAAAVNAWGACPELIAAVYFLGPLVLVLLAMSPNKMAWQHRIVVLLVLATAMLISVVVAGVQMGMTFDRVLFGVFLCWTPQSAIAAMVITLGLFVQKQFLNVRSAV